MEGIADDTDNVSVWGQLFFQGVCNDRFLLSTTASSILRSPMSPLALAALACAVSLLPPRFCSLPGAEAPQLKISYQDAARYAGHTASLSCSQAAAHERAPLPEQRLNLTGRDTKSQTHSLTFPTPHLARTVHPFASPPFPNLPYKVLVRCERQACRRAGGLAPSHGWHQILRHSTAPYPRRADGIAPWACPCGLCVTGMAAGRVGN